MKKKTLSIIVGLLTIASIAILSAMLIVNDILPTKYKYGLIAFLLIFFFIANFMSRSRNKKARIVGYIIHFLIIIMTSLTTYYIGVSLNSFDKISTSNKDVEVKNDFSLVKLKSTDLKEILEDKKLEIQSVENENEEKVKAFMNKVDSSFEDELENTKVDSYMTLAKNLINKDTELIILNEAYREIISEQIPEFNDITEVIESKSFKEVLKQKKETEVGDSFNIYISGIDTYGPIQTVSRSDVNLIVSVNQMARKILITTVPRDTYVPIAGGGNNKKDKLTHAGIYGVQSSMETLENFLDTEIDYYVKVNFNTLIDMVNVLNGIEVDNPQAFTAQGVNFPAGKIQLDGKKALIFSRERYTLKDGDRDRGRNQERVLKAMIEKATRPENLLRVNDILAILEKGAQTNVSKDFVIKMVNKELVAPSRYEIDSQDLKGIGEMGLPSYAMPGFNLYMMVPDEQSLNKVKENIKDNNTNN